MPPHFLRTWIFFGDFFLGTKMSKKELSDLRIEVFCFLKMGFFDTKNPNLQLLQVCVFGPSHPKKTSPKKRPPPKKTQQPHNPTHPKTKPLLPALPGNPGKMHDEVKREYAADEKMASSQPWELGFCGDFMPFWKPKKTGQPTRSPTYPQKQGLIIERA